MTRRGSTIETYRAADIGTLYEHDTRDLVDKYGLMAAPFFRLEISDQSDAILFSAESQSRDGGYDLHGLVVSDVEYDENDCQTNMIKLTVQNVDMTLHDSRLFAEGNSLDLWMGYDGHQPEYMGRAIIVEIEPMFESGSIPSMNITAYDIAHFMMEEGKAEIVPEGTAWFERHRQSSATGGNETPRVVHDAVDDTDRAARRNPGAATDSSGRPISMDRTPGIDIANRETRARLVEGEANQSNTEVRTTWRQWRAPRRSRNSGKVWREMKDSEIAAAIFKSYGIVPYVEATHERARASVTTGESTTTVIVGTQVADTRDEQGRRVSRARGLGLSGAVPELNVDQHNSQLDAAGGISQRESHLRAVNTTTETQQRTGGRRVVQKSGTSDWDFVKKLAKNHGYIVFVFFHHESRRWIGYWGSPSNVPQAIEYTFKYNHGDDTNFRSFRPRISMRGQKTEIDLSVVDPRRGREQRLRVAMDSVSAYSPEFRGPDGTQDIREPLGNGPEVVLTIHGRRTIVVADRPFTDPEDARRWLMAFWMRHAADFCTMEGETIIGLPEMRARQKHQFMGIGRIDGGFFITKATHKMGGSKIYNVSFSGYRVVDIMEGAVNTESDLLTVDDNALGESNPETPEV